MSELRNIARGVPGPVWRRIITVPNHTGTAAIAIPVPGKRAWEIQSVFAAFVASADAGNRVPQLALGDADNGVEWVVECPTAITAGLTRGITWAAGIGASVAGGGMFTTLPLPTPAYALPGERLSLQGATDDTDLIASIRLVVMETYTGDEIHEANAEQSIVDHWHALYELYRDRRV